MTAKDTRAIYRNFCLLHRIRTEPYNPTPANVQRWRWHIRQAQENALPKYSAPVMPSDIEAFIESRRVRTFADFPERAQPIYREIASFFPGEQVYACGSRVRGDYIERLDPPQIRQWRKEVGKADKEVSDYDFYVRPDALQFGDLPGHADRLRHGIPEHEKIPVPIMEGWDFAKLPEHEHARVIELFKAGRWGDLAHIHDQYGLSNYSYCCDVSGLKQWYKFGIEQGKIKSNG